MTSDRVARYMEDLRLALRSHGAIDASLLDEVRDHLIDAIDEGVGRGLSAEDAEHQAIGRCGSPDLIAAHVAAGTPRLRRRALLAVCAVTTLATAFLSLSLAILRPPRANYSAWTIEAALFAAQGVLTIVALRRGGSLPTLGRALLTAGGVGLVFVGISSLYRAATGHFEGYGLFFGALLIVQGALTIQHFRRHMRLPSATAP